MGRRLSELLGVPKSTVVKVIKNEPVLTQRWTLEQAKKEHAGHGKRKRDGQDPEVEEELSHWFSAVLAKDIRISWPVLKTRQRNSLRS